MLRSQLLCAGTSHTKCSFECCGKRDDTAFSAKWRFLNPAAIMCGTKKNANKSDTVGWARVCALRLFDICREMHSLTVNSHLHWALPSSDLQSFNFWHTVFFHFHSGTVFLEPSIYRTSHLETWGVSELLLLLSVSGRGKLANTAAAWASVQPFTLGHSRSVCACVCCRILCVYYIRLQIYIYRDARERRHAG